MLDVCVDSPCDFKVEQLHVAHVNEDTSVASTLEGIGRVGYGALALFPEQCASANPDGFTPIFSLNLFITIRTALRLWGDTPEQLELVRGQLEVLPSNPAPLVLLVQHTVSPFYSSSACAITATCRFQ